LSITDPFWWINKATDDLYFLNRCVLQTQEDPTPGFKDLYRPMHGKIARFLENYAYEGQNLILLLPRHWIKSYFINCGWTMQRLLKNALSGKRENFLFSHAVEPLAIRLKGRLKHNLLYNNFLRGLLSLTSPEVAKQIDDPENTAELWTKEEDVIFGNRLMTGAVEKTLESQHFDIHIGDDLVVSGNSKTEQQLEKVKDWWRLARALLSPKGIEILIGTRYSFDDLYGFLIEKYLKPKKDYYLEEPIVEVHNGNWHLLQGDCWADQENETGSTFPTMFPEEKLKRLQIELEEEFPYQYRNTPIARGQQKYKRNHFQYYREGQVPLIVNTVAIFDVTDKDKETSDYTGMVIADLGVDRKGYVRVGERRRVTDRKLIDWMCEVLPQYNPATIAIESTKYETIVELMELIIPQKLQAGDIPDGYREFVATMPHICRELKHRGRPKKIRIENMHGYVQGGKILFPEEGAENLIEELLRLGSWKTDDTADAFGYLQDVLVFPSKSDPEKISIVPERMKKTDAEREADDWEQYLKDSYLGSNPSWEDIQDVF